MSNNLDEAYDVIKKMLNKTKEDNIWKIDDKNEFNYLLGEKLIDRLDEFDNFTECEKVFYLCKCFDDEVQGSGDFYSVYTSSIGNYIYDIVNYFKLINASEISLIIDKVNKLFDEKLSEDRDEREEYISEIYEDIEDEMNEYFDEYSEYSDKLEDLLYDYAMKNKDNFKI